MEEWTKIRLENQMKNISSLEQIKPFVKNNAEDIIELLFEEINKLKAKIIEEQDFKLAYAHDLDEEGQHNINLLKEVDELKQQLTEKDKEIDKLSEEHFEMFGDMKDYKNLWLAEQRKNKEIRKQVCEEISDYINKNAYEVLTKEYGNTYVVNINEILDFIQEIEQGE